MPLINQKFKKIILSITVIVVFVFYVLVQRVQSIGLFVIRFFSDEDGVKNMSHQMSQMPTIMPMINQPMLHNTEQSFKDGDFVGKIADAFYGKVQVKAVIHGGSIVDVQFMDHPHRYPTSIMINTYAMPILKTEAIKAQSANVDGVSGASFTSRAFLESMGDALDQAKTK